jgi:hypothetical protein
MVYLVIYAAKLHLLGQFGSASTAQEARPNLGRDIRVRARLICRLPAILIDFLILRS